MDDLLSKKDNGEISVYKPGKMVKGTVFSVTDSRVLVDLIGGLTGIVTKKETAGYFDESVVPGVEIEAVVIDPENEQGLVVLSLKRASQEMIWAELNSIMGDGRIVKVKIYEANKGGLMAQYKGLKCFLPVSQLTPLNYPRVDGADGGLILKKLQSHVGKEFAVKVINVDRDNGKVIISEKSAHHQQTESTLVNLRVGDVIKGEVSGVLKYGIFVTFGGVEGLVHLSELDWGHVSDPGRHYQVGDKVEVMVIGIDGDKLSFSIKRLSEDPWKEKVKAFEKGQEVKGKILRWNTQGVFIEVKEDVQGLFPLADFGVSDYTQLSVKEGEIMKGEVVDINYDSHRLELKKAE